MTFVQTRHAIHQDHAKTMDTDALRENFLVDGLFIEGEIRLTYTHYDRFIMGAAVPNGGSLFLDHIPETGTAGFLDRREMGIMNIGETGTVIVNGETTYSLNNGDVLYVGKGAGAVQFEGQGRFYITSAPAHQSFPTRLITQSEANRIDLGAPETANERTIFQYLHPDVIETCQLVMGFTSLATGSVWNTMPCHTHDRRMEAYLYFNVAPENRVFHFLGEPSQTRHLIVGNEEGALSPPWSIHSGAGIGNYDFIWAMAGDNVDFTDMDFVAPGEMR